jgi:hypothetical protein
MKPPGDPRAAFFVLVGPEDGRFSGWIVLTRKPGVLILLEKIGFVLEKSPDLGTKQENHSRYTI